MSRGLTTAALAAVQAGTVHLTFAAEMDFSAGMVRVCAGFQDITIGGQLFQALGALGGISELREPSTLETGRWELQLSGVPSEAVSIALSQRYQGRFCKVWCVALDPATGAVIPDPWVMIAGRMDQMLVSLGADQSRVTITVTDHLADWDRARILRWTNEDQQLLAPGDRGLEYVPGTAGKELVWPTSAGIRAGSGIGSSAENTIRGLFG
jgi:hypothetical protein